MHFCEGAPINVLDLQPPGWLGDKDSTPRWVIPGNVDRDKIISQRWQAITGESPSESAFTLILPIHNEAKTLPSVLEAIRLCDLPTTLPAQIILITNACSDRSCEIVDQFLAKLGDIRSENLDPNHFRDPGLEPNIKKVLQGSISLMHLNTKTAGKANALTLGNQLASQAGHDICMSIDTNNWPEPDSFPRLYADARHQFANRQVVMISGTPIRHVRPHLPKEYSQSLFLSSIANLQRRYEAAPFNPETDNVCGWLMAWYVHWLNQIGGVPETATEDFALHALANKSPYKTGRSEAKVWGYVANNSIDLVKSAIRWMQGTFQLQALYQDDLTLQQYITNHKVFARPLKSRISHYYRQLLSTRRPISYILKTATWEVCRLIALNRARSKPDCQTWVQIRSTTG